MSDRSTRTGGCLCGAVRFLAKNVPDTCGACHCEMCRRWTGSALIEVSVANEDIALQGAECIATRRFSPWGERAWCRECGSPLWYKHVQQDEWYGRTALPLGLFDDPGGFTMTHELFSDHRPDSFGYQGQPRQITRAECVAQFSALESDTKG